MNRPPGDSQKIVHFAFEAASFLGNNGVKNDTTATIIRPDLTIA